MLHAGIKLGVFADAGTRTCGGAAASYNYEKVDAQTFADWGLSYLKYDNCNAPEVDQCALLKRLCAFHGPLLGLGRHEGFDNGGCKLFLVWSSGQKATSWRWQRQR
jgi:alpha-galactosidase